MQEPQYIIFLIQHLLSDFVHFTEAFVQNGVPKEHIFIIGIPYSTKDKIVRYLNLKEFPYIATPKEYPFNDIVKTNLLKAIELAKSTDKKILIVEDGGYEVVKFLVETV